jgi:hypothetical protein
MFEITPMLTAQRVGKTAYMVAGIDLGNQRQPRPTPGLSSPATLQAVFILGRIGV